ncbi:hypothetical protein GT50_08125 [Geobacillus stearothermophilus 10]|nr:hypothetical protein GT50_08125 [Geobacillus stearothermophilus 10]
MSNADCAAQRPPDFKPIGERGPCRSGRGDKPVSARAETIAKERNVRLTTERLQEMAPVLCSDEVKRAAEAACQKLGCPSFWLPSGAAHDGVQLAPICPIGMIFVRSQDGVSHSPAEWSTKEDCAAGAEVLYHTVWQLAQGE